MDRRVKVPIRVRPSFVSAQGGSDVGAEVVEAAPPVVDPAAVGGVSAPPKAGRPWPTGEPAAAPKTDAGGAAQPQPLTPRPAAGAGEDEDEGEDVKVWRDRALRLQAEMENFRKRQQRLADERVAADRERLLRAFLPVADDLERALAQSADGTDVESLRRGVDLTYCSLLRVLAQEGAEPVEAAGASFDPTWHEAVGAVPHEQAGAAADAIVEVIQPGYRLGERLLRPARVIVAV
jgi:molecular chaperone GrpE